MEGRRGLQPVKDKAKARRLSPGRANAFLHVFILLLLMVGNVLPSARAQERERQLQNEDATTNSDLEEALQSAEQGDEEEELQQPTAATQEPTEQVLTEPIVDFNSFSQCNYTTQELLQLSPDDPVEPCILFDIQPERLQIIPFRTSIVTLVQVTPATICNNHRDGLQPDRVSELGIRRQDFRGLSVGLRESGWP